MSKRFLGPFLLVMNNYGGHEIGLRLPNVQIVDISARSAANYQTLYLGLIVHAKTIYIFLLL